MLRTGRPSPATAHRPGHTLIEVLTTLTISLILFVLVLPNQGRSRRQNQFKSFLAVLAADLARARSHAQLTESSVRFEFIETEDGRYAYYAEEDQGDRLLGRGAWADGKRLIRNRLLGPLNHPTTGKPLQQALSSTHAPALLFGPKGSSSGTVVFSDEQGRTLCVVLSSASGRFRIYHRSEERPLWEAFH